MWVALLHSAVALQPMLRVVLLQSILPIARQEQAGLYLWRRALRRAAPVEVCRCRAVRHLLVLPVAWLWPWAPVLEATVVI